MKFEKEMLHVYLEDHKYASVMAIQFEFFVKFKKKSTIFKPKYNAKLFFLISNKILLKRK